MIETLLGGLLAIAGGFAASWFQARQTRKIRMEEIIAEKKVVASQMAYAHMKEIEGAVLQLGPEATLKLMAAKEPWLFSNRLFLPGRYPDKWLALRLKLNEILLADADSKATTADRAELRKRARDLPREALLEIYSEMNMKELSVDS